MRPIITTISIYTYGVFALALLTIVSPLIVFSVPTVLLLAWPTFMWWRRRHDRARVPRTALAMMMLVPLLLLIVSWFPLVWVLTIAAEQYATDDAGMWAGVGTLLWGPWLVAIVSFWHGRSRIGDEHPVSPDGATEPTVGLGVAREALRPFDADPLAPPTPWAPWYSDEPAE